MIPFRLIEGQSLGYFVVEYQFFAKISRYLYVVNWTKNDCGLGSARVLNVLKGGMETFSIHIKTDGRHLDAFKRLAKAVGATITTKTLTEPAGTLEQKIEEGNQDFREGRGTRMSVEQLQELVNAI
ncbi:hypothetical protein ACS5NO_24465 [Larkinella sp. GY13]|uniref:hypothetical protein n=1 Tax=Larkinella sp. GY13 TaxID=3453720 RepID=UPI003EEA3656